MSRGAAPISPLFSLETPIRRLGGARCKPLAHPAHPVSPPRATAHACPPNKPFTDAWNGAPAQPRPLLAHLALRPRYADRTSRFVMKAAHA